MSDAKIAVITGASGGLGRALIKEFAGKGWQTIGTGRSEKPEDVPEGASYEQFDASDAAAAESFWQESSKQIQRVRSVWSITLEAMYTAA
jgi:NADP-dependent 3-hydroxy acid dehydrogenase YdfG